MKNRLTISIAGVMALSIPDIVKAQNLFVADFGSGNIYEFTPGGVQSTFASGLNVLDWPSTARAICLRRIPTAATSMNLRRAERKAPLPPGCMILQDWPLTARAICLRRITSSGNIYEFTPGGVQSTFASGLDSLWTGL